jgi:hypothetical protein
MIRNPQSPISTATSSFANAAEGCIATETVILDFRKV